MNTVPDAWIIYVRRGMPIGQVADVLHGARQAARYHVDVGEAAKSARWHLEDMGDKGYIIIVETMALAGFVRGFLHQISAEYRAISLMRLRTIQSTGNAQLDKAIRNAIIALYGEPRQSIT